MNTKFLKVAFIAAVSFATFQIAPAMAIGRAPVETQIGSRFDVAVLPPVGMVQFCQSHRSQCRSDNTGTVPMTSDLLAMLQQVNSRVNNSIRPREDSGRDSWQVGVSSGDCEDYALTKRAALIRKGIPAGALRMATTYSRRGMPHAILVVKTSNGSYVLDNLTHNVRSLGSSGYRIRSIATPNPLVWAAS